MKFLKVSTMVLFSLLLVVSVSFSQESNTSESTAGTVDSGSAVVTETEKAVTAEIKSEPVTSVSDTVINKKNTAPVNKNETRKNSDKKNSDKKVTSNSQVAEVEKITPAKLDGDLLPINEGNFKYKRIPDIKLAEIAPETVVLNTTTVAAPDSGQDKDAGFLGLGKTASDVIVKGGVLLLILVIFILYKSRMAGRPGNKSSKRRNVLNSYRK